MADPNTRQGKRTPVTLKIKFKSETLEQFIERYAVDVSQGGIFIRTKEPLAVGTQMKFEFQLRDASPLIAGEGTVVWTRENDPSRPAIAPGMGVRFDRLADGSQNVLERILAEKAKQAPQRANSEGPTKPPLFTDTPTRVAPAPVQEALGVGGSAANRRARSDSEQTPLPPPRPFHSDADDFDEKAFEEATKVRSLDELAAQTAGLGESEGDDVATNTAIKMPPDELAKRRGRPDSLGEATAPPSASVSPSPAMHDRESAPGLPEPPAHTPSRPPLDSPAVARTKSGEPLARTKLGVEAAKAATSNESVPRAVPSDPSRPVAPKRPSAAPVLILLLVLAAAAAGAVWWFVLREQVQEDVATTTRKPEGSGSAGSAAVVVNNGSGSQGSADVVVDPAGSGSQGSAGSAGSAVVETPTAPLVDSVIASNAKGATIEILGTDMKGAVPFTAKLEKDKTYKARVTAPGYTPKEIAIKGGQDKITAKLSAKPHLIMVTTEPAGADIYIDGVNTQKITPAEVQLTPAQAARARVRVSLRRPGYRPVDQVIEASTFRDSDSQMSASVNARLAVQQRPTGGGTGSSGGNNAGTGSGSAATTNNGSGAGSGSATTPSGGGTGSATTPPPTGGGAGSASTPPTGGGAGSATKPPTPTPPPAAGSGSAAPSASTGGAPTGGGAPAGGGAPSGTSGATDEPEPTWTK